MLTSAAVLATAGIKSRALAAAAKQSGIKEAFADDFLIGTALSNDTIAGKNPQLLEVVAREFNSITPENCMKWGVMEPTQGQPDWQLPDRFVEFGTQHGMRIVGHTLVWHSQAPRWAFVDDKGARISSDELKKRLQTRIDSLLGRYRGRVHMWDVVNEAIEDDDKGWRKSPWFEILGPGFMELAFRMAHDADPKAHLMYNDYNEHNPGKRKFLVGVLNHFRNRGVPIHGVGFQGHIGLDYPELQEYERSITEVAATGVKIHITELDIDVLPRANQYMGAEISALAKYKDELNPYTKGLPAEVEKQLTDRYRSLFELFIKHREKIERVTFWGTHDGESWKNGFPVRGRTNYPLLFDRQLKPKPAYDALIALKK